MAKKNALINKKIFPRPPRELSNAVTVSVTPLAPDVLHTSVTNIDKAVSVHTNNVSIAGLSIDTNPSRIGSLLLEAPSAIGAVPIPASLENEALRTPVTTNPPRIPPRRGSPR